MTQAARRVASGVAGYGWVVGLVAVTGLVQVVALLRLLGPGPWSAIVLAQSAAALTSALAALGWTTIGPSVVAMNLGSAAVHVFAHSFVARMYAFVVAVPLLFVVVQSIAPSHSAAAGALAVAGVVPVLGASWYFVGTGSPRNLLLRDTAPQLLGVLIGLPLAARWGVTGYAASVLVGNACAVVLGVSGVRKDGALGLTSSDTRPRAAASFVWMHRHGLVASWSGSANSYLPMLLAASLVPGGLPAFALADRLMRYALTAFGPVVQFLQGWVPEQPAQVHRRARRAVLVALAAGGVVGAGFVTVGGTVAKLLANGTVIVGSDVLAPFALASAVLVAGQVTALVVLVPLGMSRTLVNSTLAGTAVLALGVVSLAAVKGVVGVAWAMALCEVVAVSWQVIAVLTRTREGGVA